MATLIAVVPAAQPTGANHQSGSASGLPRSRQTDLPRHRYSLLKWTVHSLGDRRNTLGSRPSWCDFRPVRSFGRTTDGMDELRGNVCLNCQHAVWSMMWSHPFVERL